MAAAAAAAAGRCCCRRSSVPPAAGLSPSSCRRAGAGALASAVVMRRPERWRGRAGLRTSVRGSQMIFSIHPVSTPSTSFSPAARPTCATHLDERTAGGARPASDVLTASGLFRLLLAARNSPPLRTAHQCRGQPWTRRGNAMSVPARSAPMSGSCFWLACTTGCCTAARPRQLPPASHPGATRPQAGLAQQLHLYALHVCHQAERCGAELVCLEAWGCRPPMMSPSPRAWNAFTAGAAAAAAVFALYKQSR